MKFVFVISYYDAFHSSCVTSNDRLVEGASGILK